MRELCLDKRLCIEEWLGCKHEFVVGEGVEVFGRGFSAGNVLPCRRVIVEECDG
jgi:hypothetical protein